MKNLFSLVAFVGCFVFFSSSAAIAQSQQIRNYTDCTFEVKVAVGQDDCNDISFQTIVVAPGTAEFVTLGAGESIQYAKGRYLGSSCAFYIGLSCSPYPPSEWVDCDTNCGDYGAKLYSWGIRLSN